MQMAYRATKKLVPDKKDTLVSSRSQAVSLIASLDKKIADKKRSRHERAVYLCGRAVLYEAIGDRKMLESALEAYNFSKTAQSAALVAVAYHHFGRIKEAIEWYERSFKYPHEAGWEIDIGYSGALLFQQTAEKWQQAWPIVKNLKKRMVYALYLKFWDGKPCKEVSVISEGGFGDLTQNARYLPLVGGLCDKVTVYLPPYFFDTGFVDLLRRQSWFPEIKPMLETPKDVPAAGFFDLPAIFNTTPETIPDYPTLWECDPEREKTLSPYVVTGRTRRPKIGFCWAARAMETPLIPDGVYRSLTDEQASRIVHKTDGYVDWFNLQHKTTMLPAGVWNTEIKNWEDTAAIISSLDAVVTVDTGVMHLAAAMGKQVYVLLSGAVDWKFGLSGDCLWYSNITVFRNDDFGFEHSVTNLIDFLIESQTKWQTVPQLFPVSFPTQKAFQTSLP